MGHRSQGRTTKSTAILKDSVYRSRLTQHRSKKESKDVTLDEFREVRSKNRELVKENKRLRKELNKFLNKEFYDEVEAQSEPHVTAPKETCPKCNSASLQTVDLGVKILVVCRDCKYRKPKEAK